MWDNCVCYVENDTLSISHSSHQDKFPIEQILIFYKYSKKGSPGGSESPAKRETLVWSLGWEDPLEKEMTTHSSILVWEIPWTEEPGRLYSSWGPKESDTSKQLNNN